LPIENGISKSLLLLKIQLMWIAAPALGAVRARVPGWAPLGAWKLSTANQRRASFGEDWTLPRRAANRGREQARVCTSTHRFWPVKAPAPASCTELRTGTERKKQTRASAKNSMGTRPNQKDSSPNFAQAITT
jgi:hypothetical protein